jgi:hypothetical protein
VDNLLDGGAYGKRLLSDAGRERVLRNEVDGVAPNRWIRGEHENDRSFRIMAAVYESLQAK